MEHRTRYWHPFADMAAVSRDGPLRLSHGSETVVTDTDGRDLLDATAGLWFCAVGHGRDEIARAASAQMSRLASYSTFGDVAPAITLELAERLVDLSPQPDGAVLLNSGGSDSIDTALKLALRYWELRGQPGRNTVVHRSRSYHGMHLGGTALAGIDANRIRAADAGFRSLEVPWDDAGALEELFDRLGPGTVAAFFCEPVVGAGGVFAPPEGYLRAVERICRAHEVLFVLDEVITGFGRMGHWFAAERYGLTPDLVTFAKGVTSGYVPLGGVVVAPTVMEPFWSERGRVTWRHGYTYSGHATACAAAMANLDVFDDELLLERARSMEGVIADAATAVADFEVVSEVRAGTGALAAFQLDPELLAADPDLGHRAVRAARDHGVLSRLLACGAMQLSPPLCASDAEIIAMVDGIAAGLSELR